MLGLLKKLFGSKPTVNPCAEAPYKVETPTVHVVDVGNAAPAEAVAKVEQEQEKVAVAKKKAPAKKAAPKKEAAPKKPGRKPKSKT